MHPFAEGRPCILGGVKIEHPRGPLGHSDADVLIHAIADAILGALGEGDIGKHFPNNDPKWKDVSSLVFLEHIRGMMAAHDAEIVNIDATVIAEAPKILPHADAMKSRIAEALFIQRTRINLKATTNEKMGFLGRGEGIAAMAVASIQCKG